MTKLANEIILFAKVKTVYKVDYVSKGKPSVSMTYFSVLLLFLNIDLNSMSVCISNAFFKYFARPFPTLLFSQERR